MRKGRIEKPKLKQLAQAARAGRFVVCNVCSCKNEIAQLSVLQDSDNREIIYHAGNGWRLAIYRVRRWPLRHKDGRFDRSRRRKNLVILPADYVPTVMQKHFYTINPWGVASDQVPAL